MGGLERGPGDLWRHRCGQVLNACGRAARRGLGRGPGNLWQHRCGRVTRVAGQHVAKLPEMLACGVYEGECPSGEEI